MLGQRRRRWPNLELTMAQWIVFSVVAVSGKLSNTHPPTMSDQRCSNATNVVTLSSQHLSNGIRLTRVLLIPVQTRCCWYNGNREQQTSGWRTVYWIKVRLGQTLSVDCQMVGGLARLSTPACSLGFPCGPHTRRSTNVVLTLGLRRRRCQVGYAE